MLQKRTISSLLGPNGWAVDFLPKVQTTIGGGEFCVPLQKSLTVSLPFHFSKLLIFGEGWVLKCTPGILSVEAKVRVSLPSILKSLTEPVACCFRWDEKSMHTH